jgi:subtilisin family serine protease
VRKLGIILLAAVLLAGLLPGSPALAAPAPQLYTVVFTSESLPDDSAALVEAAGGEVVLTIPEIGVLQARAGGGFVGRMLATPGVQTAGPAIPMVLDIPATRVAGEAEDVDLGGADLYKLYQWDIKRVTGNGASFALGTGHHGVVVGVIDTGIFPHPDLAANLLGGRNFIPAGGWGDDPSETGDPTDYLDRHGHGTHCAGTIAANGRVLGVGPGLGLRAYRVLTRQGSGSTAWIAAGMVQATKDGCRVLSLSLGGFAVMGQVFWTDPETGVTYRLGNSVASFLAYQRAVRFAVENGTVVVAAAGNARLNCANKHLCTQYLNERYGHLGYRFVGATFVVPASKPGVICVSATGPDDSLASYSNYGPGYIDLAAPGGDFQRWPEPGWWYDMCLNTYALVLPDGTPFVAYAWMAGTSMACPKVSAVAALVASACPELGAQQIAQIVMQTAEDIGRVGVDPYFGHGMVCAYRTLSLVP